MESKLFTLKLFAVTGRFRQWMLQTLDSTVSLTFILGLSTSQKLLIINETIKRKYIKLQKTLKIKKLKPKLEQLQAPGKYA